MHPCSCPTAPAQCTANMMATLTTKATTPTSSNDNEDIESGVDSDRGRQQQHQPAEANEQTRLLPVASSTTSTDKQATEITDATEGSSTQYTAVAAEAIPASSIRQTAMTGFAGLGFLTSLISMMAEYSASAIQHPAMVISGCLGLILSPYAKFQQEKLTQVKALEQTNSVLEDELKYLQQEYEKITKHLETVDASTTKLRSLQSALSIVQSANIKSVDQLEKQVQQAKEIVSQFQQNTQAMILQNLITVLVNCDSDHTMTLDDNEIDKLIKSLESIHNVQFNDTKMRQLILDNQRSVTAIMEIARNLISKTSVSSSTLNNTTTANAADGTAPPTFNATISTAIDATQPPGTTFENETIFSYIEK